MVMKAVMAVDEVVVAGLNFASGLLPSLGHSEIYQTPETCVASDESCQNVQPSMLCDQRYQNQCVDVDMQESPEWYGC